MRIAYLPLIVMGVGVFLIALSVIWPSRFGRAAWSEQQAREHAEASARLHRLAHERAHASDHAGESSQQQEPEALQQAKERYQRPNAALQRARFGARRTAKIFRWTGILCSLLGAAGYLLVLRAADHR